MNRKDRQRLNGALKSRQKRKRQEDYVRDLAVPLRFSAAELAEIDAVQEAICDCGESCWLKPTRAAVIREALRRALPEMKRELARRSQIAKAKAKGRRA